MKAKSFKSLNKNVVKVEKTGIVKALKEDSAKITAKKKGTCTITDISSNGKKEKCKITVKK